MASRGEMTRKSGENVTYVTVIDVRQLAAS